MPAKVKLEIGETVKTVNGLDTHLIYLGEVKDINTRRKIRLKCTCDTEFESTFEPIRGGRNKSCGCLRGKLRASGQLAYKHGLSRTPEYSRLKHLYQHYGLTLENYERMWKEQNGCCAICGIDELGLNSKYKTGKLRRLHVDHDHNTGKIRKLLCNGCNRGIGYFNDNPEKCLKAFEYLNSFSDGPGTT